MNSPLVYIDPDGMSAEGWSTRFVNPFGSTLVNTNDGSDDVVIVPWGSVADLMHDVNSSRDALARGEVPAWNQKWKNRFGVAISQKILDESGYYFLGNEDTRAAQVKYIVTKSNHNWKAFLKELKSERWSDRVLVATSILGFAHGIVDSLEPKPHFGYREVENNVNHAIRYLKEAGLDINKVKAAISRDLGPASSCEIGARITGIVIVDGVTIKYSGIRLPNGRINIGTIQPPRKK